MQKEEHFAALAQKHFVALKDFLVEHLQKEQAGISPQRQSAREKLTRLTHSQFHELSTDVYDEMNRRLLPNNQDNKSVPYLPFNESYHQKRNQARQKLATLSENRFKDLASDVYCELERRYPELNKPVAVKQMKSVEVLGTRELSVSPETREESPKQQQPMESQEAAGLVNFMSLDNLMADLGNMITSTSQSPTKSIPSSNKQTTPVRGDVKPFHPVQESASVDLKSVEGKQGQKASDDRSRDLDQLIVEKEQLQKAKQSLQAELEGVQEKLQVAEVALKQAKERQVGFDAEVASYKSTIGEMDASQIKLEEQLKDNEDTINALKEQVQSLKDELQARDIEIASHKESVLSVNSKIERYVVEIKELKGVIDQKDIVILNMTSDLDKLKGQLSDLNKGRNGSITGNSQSTPKDILSDIVDAVDLNNSNYHSKDGQLAANDLMSLKTSVRDLLKSCRKQSASDILAAMKAVVSCTRLISDTSSSNDARSNMNDSLTTFMAHCKTYAMEVSKNSNLQMPKNIDDSAKLFMQTVQVVVMQQKIKFLIQERRNSETLSSAEDPVKKASSPGKDKSVSPTKEHTMSVEELKLYLEKQTDIIVQNIQLLLQSMRSSTFDDEFHGTINNITTVVDSLVKQSGATLNERCAPEVQKKGNVTITALKESNVRLSALGNQTTSTKPSKQKLAAAAYELAKFTKELVSIFE